MHKPSTIMIQDERGFLKYLLSDDQNSNFRFLSKTVWVLSSTKYKLCDHTVE